MRVAVVANTTLEAAHVIARLGMVRTAIPLSAEMSPLFGMRFSAVVVVARKGVRDFAWWVHLGERCDGPWFALDEWGGPSESEGDR